MDQSPIYAPVAAPPPSPTPQTHKSRLLGYLGIVSAVISLLFLPPVFGTIGIILGVYTLKQGEKSLGLVDIILSVVFMVIGILLGIVTAVALEEASSFIFGAFLNLF